MKNITIKKKDKKLFAILETPKDCLRYPLVIFCHGLGGNKESWAHIVQHFLKNNIAVLRFDFSGHGESEGKFEDTTLSSQLDDLLFVYEHAKNIPKVTFIGLFGHSFGGLVSLIFSIVKKVNAIVCVAAPYNIKNSLNNIFGSGYESIWKNKGYLKIPWNNKNLKYSFYEDLEKYNISQLLLNVNTPLMVIHGDKDQLVPLNDAKEIYNIVKGAKSLNIIKDADHSFSSKENELTTAAIFWFSKWLK